MTIDHTTAAQAPKQDPISEAINILTADAASIRESHTPPCDRDDWNSEPDAKAYYDRLLRVAGELSRLRAPVADGRAAFEADERSKGKGSDLSYEWQTEQYLDPWVMERWRTWRRAWKAASAALASAPVAHAATKQDALNHFDFLEGLVDQQTLEQIADAALALRKSAPVDAPPLREGVAYLVKDAWGGYWQTVVDGHPYTFRASAPVAGKTRDAVDYVRGGALSFDAYPDSAPVAGEAESQCANCGKPASQAKHCISEYPEEGEWFCSEECEHQHGILDCPQVTHTGYRHPAEAARLIAAENVLRSLASWLGCGGFNPHEVNADEFEQRIRDGVDSFIQTRSSFAIYQWRLADSDGWNDTSEGVFRTKQASHGASSYQFRIVYAAPQASEAVRDAALEEAAAVAKGISDKYAFGYYGQEVDTADEIEREIRALKSRAALSAQPGAQKKGGSDA